MYDKGSIIANICFLKVPNKGNTEQSTKYNIYFFWGGGGWGGMCTDHLKTGQQAVLQPTIEKRNLNLNNNLLN